MAGFRQRDEASDFSQGARLPQFAIAFFVQTVVISFIKTANYYKPDAEARSRLALVYCIG